MLVAAGLAGARDHALISLLALNGLRVSEALGADIEDLGLERGHRTLTILRKGGKGDRRDAAPRLALVAVQDVAASTDDPLVRRRPRSWMARAAITGAGGPRRPLPLGH